MRQSTQWESCLNVSTIKQKALKFMSHLVTVISLECTVFSLANIYLGTSLGGLVDHLIPLWIVFVLIQVLLLLLIIHSILFVLIFRFLSLILPCLTCVNYNLMLYFQSITSGCLSTFILFTSLVWICWCGRSISTCR